MMIFYFNIHCIVEQYV